MSDETSYLILVYVFGEMKKVVVTFKNDFLSSDDIKYFKEPDVVEKISSALPQLWSDKGKDFLEVIKLDYLFPEAIDSLREKTLGGI